MDRAIGAAEANRAFVAKCGRGIAVPWLRRMEWLSRELCLSRMAVAMKAAVEAGRSAFIGGRIPGNYQADA